MDHSELVQEMVLLEKLTAQERLKHAKRRRQQQLTNWARREAASGNNSTTMTNGTFLSNNTSTKSIRSKKFLVKFPENIVLLEGIEIIIIIFLSFILFLGR
jgi:protein phosphatase 1 regulatory subunit 16A